MSNIVFAQRNRVEFRYQKKGTRIIDKKKIIFFSGFENTKLFGSTNTGLSQSDLSICSQGSVNPSYRYGNQLEYDAGHFGYAIYDSDSQSRKLEGSSKWVEFDKSPDIDKTLLTDYKAPSIDKETSENVRDFFLSFNIWTIKKIRV